MKKINASTNGFHFIELLVTLVMIGILSSMGLAVYGRYFVKATRLHAGEVLVKLAVAMEGFHVGHDTYQHATLNELGFSESIAASRYHLEIRAANENTYLLAASPMESDEQCGTLLLNAAGKKSITGTGVVEDCW